jgi:hypothetical protein
MTTPIDGQQTLNLILLKQGEILSDIAIIKTKLEAVPDHESRLRAVETSLTRVKAIASLIAGVIALVTSTLGTLITVLTRH